MTDNDRDRGRSRIPNMNNQAANESMDDRLIDYINNPDESVPFIQLGTPGPRKNENMMYMEGGKEMMMNSGGDGSSGSKSEFTYNTKDKDEDMDSGGGFLQVFDIYDFSFLVVIFICNFAQGFRRLLELGLYFVFKQKLGL